MIAHFHMSSRLDLLGQQRAWAVRAGAVPDARGYLDSYGNNLFQALSERALSAFQNGGGSELSGTVDRRAKMAALHSSAALAVNVFDYWADRDLSPVVKSLNIVMAATSLEFEAQFSTGLGGTPPNLDIALCADGGAVLGLESTLSEWLTAKSPRKEHFKAKYFPEQRSLWEGVGLRAAQGLAESLQHGKEQFRHLDAAQLLKHMLGLATCHQGKASLYYLYFDWPGRESSLHREEIERFQRLVAGDMPFHYDTYQQVFRRLAPLAEQAHGPYVRYLRERYFLDGT